MIASAAAPATPATPAAPHLATVLAVMHEANARVFAERMPRRGYAARWYPDAGHGTTPVVTVEHTGGLTLEDVLAVARGIAESGAEPRLAFTFDDAGLPQGFVIGARAYTADVDARRGEADELLARYRHADGDGLDELARQEAHVG